MSREAGWAPKLLPSRGGVSRWKSPQINILNIGQWPGRPKLLITTQSQAS